MRIESSICAIYDYMPTGKSVAKTMLTMATAAIALEAISYIPAAAAGPITYGLCIGGCAFATPPALPFCLAACAPSLGPWCP
jgi:hypothetical protein